MAKWAEESGQDPREMYRAAKNRDAEARGMAYVDKLNARNAASERENPSPKMTPTWVDEGGSVHWEESSEASMSITTPPAPSWGSNVAQNNAAKAKAEKDNAERQKDTNSIIMLELMKRVDILLNNMNNNIAIFTKAALD